MAGRIAILLSAAAMAAIAVLPAAGADRDALDQALQQRPFHQSLKLHFPDAYDDLLARALEAGEELPVAEQAAGLLAAAFLAENAERLREAPDAELSALLNAERALVAAAEAELGGAACAAWLADDPASTDMASGGLRELYQTRAASAVEAIAAAATMPADREDPDVGDWESFWEDAGSDRLNRELLKKTLNADPVYPEACDVYLRFLDAMAAKAGGAGERIRALWAARVAAAAPPG